MTFENYTEFFCYTTGQHHMRANKVVQADALSWTTKILYSWIVSA